MKLLVFILLIPFFAKAQLTINASSVKVGTITNPPPAAAGPNNPVFASLTHVWHMEEASGNARVDSVGSISLAETGGAVSMAAGKHGNAAHLFGTTHTLQAASAESPSTVSVAFWVYLTTLPDGGILWLPFYGSTSADPVVPFRIFADGSISLQGDIDTSTVQSPVSTITPGSWHLVVGVCNFADAGNPATERLSVDGGTFIDEIEQDGPTIAADTSWTMGSSEVAAMYVDEVMIFSTPLTQGNVTTLWNSGAGLFYTP